ncbi:Hsp20 family protein [Candidatus Dojkabacteria bacterium]|nr:Hsp20 family protein [Candidatus Dojkabacteria bacterium]
MRKNRRLALFDPRRVFSDDFLLDNFFSPFDVGEYSPIAVDLYEDDDNIVAEFNNISGFDNEDLDISIEDNVLTVSASSEKQEQEKDEKRKYFRKEIRCDSFSRSIALPTKVKSEKAEAELEKGILKIKMPKADEVKPKKIEIKAKKKE